MALGVVREQIPADTGNRAAMLRSLLHGRRMLVVLDNAHTAAQVRPLLPGGTGSLVLVTSRNRLDDLVMSEGASRISLEVLPQHEARDLLIRYLGPERVEAEPSAVDALISCCAGLPLALSIVAFRATRLPEVPLAELVEEVSDEQERLDALDTGGETGVRAVFSWSYRSLSPEAARLFRLLGLPSGPDIGLDAVAALAAAPRRAARRVLRELTQAHLVEQRGAFRYEMHDLLRAYAAECAAQDEPQADRGEALRRLADFYLRTSQGIERSVTAHSRLFVPEPPGSEVAGKVFDDPEDGLAWWDAERPNLLAATKQAAAESAQPGAKKALTEIWNAEDKPHALQAITTFETLYGAKFPKAVAKVTDDIDELLAFYDYPAEHWIHLRTTNPIESTFATVRHRTKVTKGPGSRAAGLAMAFKLIESAQTRWRAVNAPHLAALVRAGTRFEAGKPVERYDQSAA